jgi:hypothetical protein
VIIVTPALGWAEPRPHQLITGDRAIKLLDTTSSAALQKAGVKLATVSHSTYQKLVDELIPEVFEGLDPDTGKLKEEVLPSFLTAAAIDDVDLRGGDGRIEEQYLPTRLSATAINEQLAGLNSTKTETDPDGVPVILATDTGSNDNDNWTVTGVATLNEVNASDLHVDLFDATVADIVALETDEHTFAEQSVTPGDPAVGKYKLYFDATQRPLYRGNAGIERRFATKRHVTSWPVDGQSYLGDEAINTVTGEHRVYLGASQGWRLASPFSVATLGVRDALTNLYDGYRVYCTFGVPQEHVWQDGAWHGTKTFVVAGNIPSSATSGVNDSNFRRYSTTTITDPGYAYYLHGHVQFRVNQNNQKHILDVWCSTVDTGTTNNLFTFAKWLEDDANRVTLHVNISPICATAQSGSKDVIVDWKVRGNSANAFTDNYQAAINWLVIPQ